MAAGSTTPTVQPPEPDPDCFDALDAFTQRRLADYREALIDEAENTLAHVLLHRGEAWTGKRTRAIWTLHYVASQLVAVDGLEMGPHISRRDEAEALLAEGANR